MNNVMALCHFCEQHGPSIMFTCEKLLLSRLEASADFMSSVSSQEAVADTPGGSTTDTDMSSLSSLDSLASNLTIAGKENVKKTDLCEACRSLSGDDNGFISHDKQAGTSFTSMQHPNSPEVFRLVRQACVRSLSSEVCPGREGPILFGDEQDGYVISYTFYVKDVFARGGQRWYSIICIMADRVFLVQSWPFLVGCINRVVDYLQKAALDTSKNENVDAPQPCSTFKARVSNVMTPRNFRQQRGADSSNARSLITLTGNPKLYQYLHTAFTWIMRACAKRLKETVVHGPSTDEEIVRAELLARSPRSDSVTGNDTSEQHLLSLTALTPETRTKHSTIFSSLRHMRDVLQPHLFRAIAWHLLIGNQVIWRGRDQELITSALHVLKDILPIGCVKILTGLDSYVNSYKANLLGLNKVQIPSHVTNSEHHILVDVVPKTTATQRRNQIYPSLFETSSQHTLRGVEFHITSGCIIPEKGPSMLNNLEVVLANDSLAEEVVQQCLVCLKQEWINKVKILYKFTKIDNRDKEDTSKLLQTCLNCTEEDVRLLKHWMKGLSSQYKDELRQSALSQST